MSTKAEAYFKRYRYPDWLETHSRVVGAIAEAPPRLLREASQPATTGASLSRNLGDFDCSPRLAKVATLNRQAAAATRHADERHGVKAARKG